MDWGPGTALVGVQSVGIIIALLLMGVAIDAGQSISAFSVSLSQTGKNSLAFGMHNTARFMGLATGFAWTALLYPVGSMLLLFAGAAVAAAAAMSLVVSGGPLTDR